MQFQKILVPTDFSETANAALEMAVTLAEKLGAEVLLLHVNAIPDLGIPIGIEVSTLPSLSSFQTMLRERVTAVQGAIGELRKKYAQRKVRITEVVRDGMPAQEIANAAKEMGADLIAMGRHGRRGFAHFLLGSTTDEVLRIATCPVLVVRTSG